MREIGRWRRRRRHWRRGIAGLAMLVLGLLGLVVFDRAKPPPLPNPNGYDDLVLVGRSVRGKVPANGDVAAATEAELLAFVEPNAEALRLARLGLGRECRVPVQYSQDYMTVAVDHVGPIRQAQRLLAAAGRLAELQGRRPEAIRSYLDEVRLGQTARRGGLLIDTMVGLACEARGLDDLRGLRADLSAAECRDLIRMLEAFDREREPLAAILAREDDWRRRSFGLREKLAHLVSASTIRKLQQPAEQSAEFALRRNATMLRLLMTDLALRAYRLEHGTDPKSLSDLVPNNLMAIPIDPFGTRPLVYRSGPEGTLLYSIGPDGQDNDGQPLTEPSINATTKGDVLLDPK